MSAAKDLEHVDDVSIGGEVLLEGAEGVVRIARGLRRRGELVGTVRWHGG